VVVACRDARLNIYGMLGLKEGDAHVIRYAGGAARDDEIRSLMISQRLLGTRETVLIQHTDCGMLTFIDDEAKAQIQQEVGIKPEFALQALSDLDEWPFTGVEGMDLTISIRKEPSYELWIEDSNFLHETHQKPPHFRE
jgi:carbonic anhydrase